MAAISCSSAASRFSCCSKRAWAAARASAADASSVLSCWWRASSAFCTGRPAERREQEQQRREVAATATPSFLPSSDGRGVALAVLAGAGAVLRPRAACSPAAGLVRGGMPCSCSSATRRRRGQDDREQARDDQRRGELHDATSRPRILRAAAGATCDASRLQLRALGGDAAFSRVRASASVRWAAAFASASSVCSRACASARATARSPAPGRRASASADVGARQPLLRVRLQLRRLLAVALDARDPLGAHAQVGLPQERARTTSASTQENSELQRTPSRRCR